jgi:hypothetical protein
MIIFITATCRNWFWVDSKYKYHPQITVFSGNAAFVPIRGTSTTVWETLLLILRNSSCLYAVFERVILEMSGILECVDDLVSLPVVVGVMWRPWFCYVIFHFVPSAGEVSMSRGSLLHTVLLSWSDLRISFRAGICISNVLWRSEGHRSASQA